MNNIAVDFEARTGTHVDLVAGPTPTWKDRAIADADVIFSGSENMMTDFTTQLPGVLAESTIVPALLRARVPRAHSARAMLLERDRC